MRSPALSVRRGHWTLIGVCLVATLVGCSPSVTTITAAPTPVDAAPRAVDPVIPETLERVIGATFEAAPCDDLTTFAGLDVEPECGWLSTPMLGSNSKVIIELPVVIFRATGEHPAPDPIIYLHGGPAGGIVEYAADQYESIVEPFVAQRDVVLFDQRGSGLAKPSLDCDPAQNFWSDPNQDDDVEYIERRAKTCAWRLRNHGVTLTEFNRLRSADDVMVLARELGYEQINLIGTSWGGLLATTIMAEQPELVRAALLNSPLSYETDLAGSMPASYREAIGALQAACDEDQTCAARHGDIADRFAAVTEALDREPLELSLIAEPGAGYDHEWTVDLTGEELVHLVFGLLYSPEAISSIPDLILDLENRDPRLATRMASIYGWGWGFDFGFLTYMCTDVVPASSLEAVAQQQTGVPVFDRIDDVPDGRGHTAPGLCDAMDVIDAGPRSSTTDLPSAPTLVFSGRLDPITSYSSGVSLAESMPEGRFVGFDDLSHGALHDWCAIQIAVEFFASPERDLEASCAENRTQFKVTDSALSIHGSIGISEPVQAQIFVEDQTISVQAPAGFHRASIDVGAIWWRDDAPYDLTAFAVFGSGDDWTAEQQVELWFENMEAFDSAAQSTLNWGDSEWIRREALSPFGVALVSLVRDDGEVAMMLQAYPEEAAELEAFMQSSAGALGELA